MSNARLFRFGLSPISDVCPWERNGRKHVHWFGLTDGWYTIDCSGTELLRLSRELIEASPNQAWPTPYFNYPVARLHEDVLRILPAVLDPIPPDIVDLVRTPDLERAFVQRSRRWLENHWDSAFWAHAAGWWIDHRQLDRGHMAGQPEIRFWSEGDQVTIRWNNDCGVDEDTGRPWNSVPSGEHSIPRPAFLDELRLFHDRLMLEMEQRVGLATSTWPLPDVEIDANELAREHRHRSRSLDDALKRAEKVRTDWTKVRAATTELIRLVNP